MNFPAWYPKDAVSVYSAALAGRLEITGGDFPPAGFDLCSIDSTLSPVNYSCVFDPEFLVKYPSEDTLRTRRHQLGLAYPELRFWRHIYSPAWIEQGVPIRHYKFMEQKKVKSNPIFSKPLPLP